MWMMNRAERDSLKQKLEGRTTVQQTMLVWVNRLTALVGSPPQKRPISNDENSSSSELNLMSPTPSAPRTKATPSSKFTFTEVSSDAKRASGIAESGSLTPRAAPRSALRVVSAAPSLAVPLPTLSIASPPSVSATGTGLLTSPTTTGLLSPSRATNSVGFMSPAASTATAPIVPSVAATPAKPTVSVTFLTPPKSTGFALSTPRSVDRALGVASPNTRQVHEVITVKMKHVISALERRRQSSDVSPGAPSLSSLSRLSTTSTSSSNPGGARDISAPVERPMREHGHNDARDIAHTNAMLDDLKLHEAIYTVEKEREMVALKDKAAQLQALSDDKGFEVATLTNKLRELESARMSLAAQVASQSALMEAKSADVVVAAELKTMLESKESAVSTLQQQIHECRSQLVGKEQAYQESLTALTCMLDTEKAERAACQQSLHELL
jgi:hypothetical protein